jgi:hypothetical protein
MNSCFLDVPVDVQIQWPCAQAKILPRPPTSPYLRRLRPRPGRLPPRRLPAKADAADCDALARYFGAGAINTRLKGGAPRPSKRPPPPVVHGQIGQCDAGWRCLGLLHRRRDLTGGDRHAASAMSVVQSRCGVSAKVSRQGTAESILRERLVGRPRHLERS